MDGPGIDGVGRRGRNVYFVVAFKERGETTHFEKGVVGESST